MTCKQLDKIVKSVLKKQFVKVRDLEKQAILKKYNSKEVIE